MTIAFSQATSASNGGSTATVVIGPLTNALGNFLCVIVDGSASPNATTPITDTIGNTHWTQVTTNQSNSGPVTIFYCWNCKAGANTVTVNYSNAGTNFYQGTFGEWSGVMSTADPFDTANSNTGASGTMTPGNVIASTSGELGVAAYSGSNNSDPASPWNNNWWNFNFGQDLADYNLSVSGSSNNPSTGSSGGWNAVIALFKPPASGGGGGAGQIVSAAAWRKPEWEKRDGIWMPKRERRVWTPR